jgi:glycosyltransferase involved in cell wall biosynthesis
MTELEKVEVGAHLAMLPYPIDISLLLDGSRNSTHETGDVHSPDTVYASTSIALHALANWNAYLSDNSNEHRELFLHQANWLLAHKSLLSNGACGWPVSSAANGYSVPCLSASMQGTALSVLLRAYQLSGEDAFLHVAHQAVRTFELDILDGGVSAPIGNEGLFFEGVAIYPAAHILSAHMLALFGLYEYVACVHDTSIDALIQRGMSTLNSMLDAFDTGYWTRRDLLHKRLASRREHSLHIRLLEALAGYAGCEQCISVAARWSGYQRHPASRLRSLVVSRSRSWWDSHLKSRLRNFFFRSNDEWRRALSYRVCIPITAFPVAGGMRSVLAGVARVMHERWEMLYLTRHKGQEAQGLEIETFGRRSGYWQFPAVWLYCIAGGSKLVALLRRGSGYDLILPQDGVFSGAFAALIGKLAGIRVVCMDHGNVTLLNDPAYRSQVIRHIKGYPWYRRIVARLQLAFYWPSLRLLARIATNCSEQFLIAGDEVETVYRERFHVHPSRITRYAYMVDAERFTPPAKQSRTKMRLEQGISEDAIVVTLINRLAPEKGLHFASEGIARALAVLPINIRARVKVLIAGEGPLRAEVQADIERHELTFTCKLWGEAGPQDVVMLLAVADIFLYSGTRGTNYSMAVLEAMAAGCAVIASTSPLSNARLLADGRGVAVAAEDAEQISQALVLLLNDLKLCHKMGQLARNYVAMHHSAASLRRTLARVSGWSSLDEFLHVENDRRI